MPSSAPIHHDECKQQSAASCKQPTSTWQRVGLITLGKYPRTLLRTLLHRDGRRERLVWPSEASFRSECPATFRRPRKPARIKYSRLPVMLNIYASTTLKYYPLAASFTLVTTSSCPGVTSISNTLYLPYAAENDIHYDRFVGLRSPRIANYGWPLLR